MPAPTDSAESSPAASVRQVGGLHAATTFLSSLLLFLVQPIIAKRILPWFGGTAAVWTTCMLFFQSVLLAGYAYAHLVISHLTRRRQAVLHTVLLAAALASLPIIPADRWRDAGAGHPIAAILLVLAATVGLPYLLLSATSPLVQAWFHQDRPGQDPYRLYAVSNLASMLALMGYPFLMEPWLGNRLQALSWSAAFGAFAVLCALLAWRGRTEPAQALEAPAEAPPPTAGDYAVWLALSAAAGWLLLAVTNHLCQNLAGIPLLWLAPLTVYLLSFIIAFDGRGSALGRRSGRAILVALAAMAAMLVVQRFRLTLTAQIGVYLAGLFVACLYLNSEVYRSRPASRHLTAFYITISLGGAVGALVVAVGAPLILSGYFELGYGLIFTAMLVAYRMAPAGAIPRWSSIAVMMGVVACVATSTRRFGEQVIASRRNFYGVLRVLEVPGSGDWEPYRRLLHGTINHGEQVLTAPERYEAGTYYTDSSGIGAAILARQARSAAMRVGVIGLGTGTLAAYGRAGDVYRFYDIDPDVVDLARTEFTYLADSKAKVEVVLGDARTSLEREPDQELDVLAVDAFAGDSIPVHLMTQEALRTYLRHIKPDGVVAFHVSNRYLNLRPVVEGLAEATGTVARGVFDPAGDDKMASDWILVSRDRQVFAEPQIADADPVEIAPRPGLRPWTDDYSNLVQILK